MSTVRNLKRPSTGPRSTRLAAVLTNGSALNLVAKGLSTALDRALAEHELTAQQGALLMHASSLNSSPSQLMTRLGTDTAGMTKLIDRLEAKGLLARRRNTTDRRSILVDVTDAGARLAPKVPTIFGNVTLQLFEGFTTQELTTLTTMLQRMNENLTTSRAAAPAP